MSKLNFMGGQVQLFDDNGDPLAGGKVYFYEPGTTTNKDTYTDSDLVTANANPVVLDAYGRASIWLNGDYKAVVKDSNDVTIYTEDNVNPAQTAATVTLNLVSNGSFETNSNGDGKTPDDWDLTEETDSTVVLDSSDQQSGEYSIKFTSAGSGGGNIIQSEYMECSPNRALDISWQMISSDAGVRNVVEILWYDKNKASISSTTLFDDDTTNPTTWTKKQTKVTPPSTARFAKLRLYGCHPSDATTGSTWYDDVVVTFLPTPNWEKGSDIASAAALGVDSAGNYFDVTGTTAITSLNTKGGNAFVKLHFDDVLTLTHHATDLILPGGANITTAAGDEAEFYEYDTGDWRCVSYTRASGRQNFENLPYDQGTQSSGTLTPEPSEGSVQIAVNGGAHTLAPPTEVGLPFILTYTNNASAGAITTSGFDFELGDAFDTTENNRFECLISYDGTTSVLQITALQ